MDVQAILPFEARRALRMVLPQSLLNWREAKFYGRYGEVELHLLKFLCRRDADAIDVGANDGSYVHYLRRHAHKVVAFEPMPVLASALRKKFPGGRSSDRAGRTVRPCRYSRIAHAGSGRHRRDWLLDHFDRRLWYLPRYASN